VGGELAEPNEFDLAINLKTATAFWSHDIEVVRARR
jgi:hypothetical protein